MCSVCNTRFYTYFNPVALIHFVQGQQQCVEWSLGVFLTILMENLRHIHKYSSFFPSAGARADTVESWCLFHIPAISSTATHAELRADSGIVKELFPNSCVLYKMIQMADLNIGKKLSWASVWHSMSHMIWMVAGYSQPRLLTKFLETAAWIRLCAHPCLLVHRRMPVSHTFVPISAVTWVVS